MMSFLHERTNGAKAAEPMEDAPNLIEPDEDEPSLSFPSIGDLASPLVPDDSEAPAELQPKKTRRRTKKKEQELTTAISEMLQMANFAFLTVAPCGCAQFVPADQRSVGIHLDTCPQTWALNGEEGERITAAVAGEFEAHPEWLDRVSDLGGFLPHIVLGFALFSVVIERRSRVGVPVHIGGGDVVLVRQQLAEMQRENAAPV